MAITYLSGQRIQGIGEISGYKGWTTSGSGWSETTSDGKNIVKATNPSYTSSFHGSVYELPETVGSTFLLRWTIKVTSVTAYSSGSHQFVAWLGGLTIDGSDTAMDQTGGVGLNYGTNPSITWGGKVATGELGGGVDGVNSFGTVSATTTKYIEAVGTDTNDYEIRMYSNSDYSDTPTTKSYTNSGFTGSNALKFIRFSGGSHSSGTGATGNITAEFSDVKFWNNQTTASGDPDVEGFADTPSDKSTVTDVPTGSQFEETDTRKFYQMGTETVSGTELRAYWKYDETSGTTFTNDEGNVTGNNSVGAGANLTLSGVTLNQSGSPSNLGVNASWDGSNDYAQQQSGNEGDFNFLHNGSDWSICFWAIINNRSPFANQEIIDNHGGSGTANGIDVRTRDNETIKIVAYGGGTKFIDVQPANDYIPDFTNFHYYCMTWDNSEKQVSWYRDGALFQQQTEGNGGGSGSATGELTIGGYWNDETGGSFDGNLCEMAIFARVLSSAEISTLYQNGAGMQLDTGAKVWVERGTAI